MARDRQVTAEWIRALRAHAVSCGGNYPIIASMDMIALCDAMAAKDAEIARLREALTALAGGGVRVREQWFRDHGMPEVADRREAYADALARAALAPPDPPDGVA